MCASLITISNTRIYTIIYMSLLTSKTNINYLKPILFFCQKKNCIKIRFAAHWVGRRARWGIDLQEGVGQWRSVPLFATVLVFQPASLEPWTRSFWVPYTKLYQVSWIRENAVLRISSCQADCGFGTSDPVRSRREVGGGGAREMALLLKNKQNQKHTWRHRRRVTSELGRWGGG